MEKNVNSYDINIIITDRIEALMEQANEKFKSLAIDIGITPQTLSKIMNHTQTINPEQLIRIAKHYNVSTDYLLGLTEEKDIHISIVKYLYDNIKISKGSHSKEKAVFSQKDLERFLSEKGFGMKLSPKLEQLLCDIADLQSRGSILKKAEFIERIEKISRKYNSCCISNDQSKSVFYRLMSERDLVEAVEEHIGNAEELKLLLNSSFKAVQSDE